MLGVTTGAELAVIESAPKWLLPERRGGRDLPRFAEESSVILFFDYKSSFLIVLLGF